MRLVAALIIAVSLTLGLIASVTAYTPRLADISPDDRLALNAPAGIAPDEDEAGDGESGVAIHTPDPRVIPAAEEDPIILTAELIEQLKEDGEVRVRVKEFGWSRWTGRYLFTVACVGLLAGSIMLRLSSKPKASVSPGAGVEEGAGASPLELLRTAHERLRELEVVIESKQDDEALREILHRLDMIRDEQFEPFVASRPVLVQRFGVTGYAQIMDLFATAERRLNRAWSASADHVPEEAFFSLREGTQQLEQAIALLEQRSG